MINGITVTLHCSIIGLASFPSLGDNGFDENDDVARYVPVHTMNLFSKLYSNHDSDGKSTFVTFQLQPEAVHWSNKKMQEVKTRKGTQMFISSQGKDDPLQAHKSLSHKAEEMLATTA